MPQGTGETGTSTNSGEGSQQGTGDPQAQSQGDNQGQSSAGGESKTFTQEELNQIVRDRLARETSKYKDYNDLKSKATKFDELQAQNQSELDKALERASNAETKAAEADTKLRQALVRSAVVSEATRLNAVDPDAVFALLDRTTIEIKDDGTIEGVKSAVESLMQEKPYLKSTTRTGMGNLNTGVQGTGTTGEFTRSQIADPKFFKEHEKEIMLAFREGRIKDG